jgi:ADP-L-glycero-D-manno-heptose 6-epimerase
MPDRGCFVVTGGAGFIGSRLAAALIKAEPGAEVVVIDDLRSGSFANLTSAMDRADLSPFSHRFITEPIERIDAAALASTRGLRAVFHMAGLTDPDASEAEVIRANSAGFEPLLAACIQTGIPLIYASSAAVYGSPAQAKHQKPFPLEAAGRPTTAVGFSKWLMECQHVRLGQRTALGMPHVVGLRYFDVFGHGESRDGRLASKVYKLAASLLAGKQPRVTPGSPARDFISIDDAVAATLAALGIGTNVRPRPGIYNIGSGVAIDPAQVLAVLREELAVPESAVPNQPCDHKGCACGGTFALADLSATISGLGWKPTTNPIEAVRAYARCLRSSH